MKKNTIVLSIIIALTSSFSVAQESTSKNQYSIKDVANTDLLNIYKLALSNDSLYRISEANLRSTEQNIDISRSSLLPQISASARLTRRDTDNAGQGLDGSPSDPFNNLQDTTSFSIRLDQSIFDWSQWLALEQAELRFRAAELNHAATLQTLMTRTAQAYFNVLSAEENLSTTQAEKESLLKQLNLTREQYESGLANATDYLNAQANYDQSVASEVSLQNSLTIAQESLREITGNYYLKLEGIEDNLKLSNPSPDNIDDWMRVASESNLGLKAQQMNVKVANQEIKRNRNGHYPKANFDITYSDTDSDTERTFPQGTTTPPTPPGSVFNSDTQSDGYTANLTLSVPIYSGNRTSSQTEQAKQGYLSSTYQLEQTARQVQRNTRNAFNNLKAALASYKAFKRSLNSSKSSLEATEDGYQAGTRNIIDVLAATRSFYAAQRSLTRAKYDYLINTLNLKKEAGILTEKDIVEVNQWLLRY